MRNEFTAVIEREDDRYIGYSPEFPGVNGQGRTIEECRASLADAIALILEDRREDGLRGVPADAIRETVTVEWARQKGTQLFLSVSEFPLSKPTEMR